MVNSGRQNAGGPPDWSSCSQLSRTRTTPWRGHHRHSWPHNLDTADPKISTVKKLAVTQLQQATEREICRDVYIYIYMGSCDYIHVHILYIQLYIYKYTTVYMWMYVDVNLAQWRPILVDKHRCQKHALMFTRLESLFGRGRYPDGSWWRPRHRSWCRSA